MEKEEEESIKEWIRKKLEKEKSKEKIELSTTEEKENNSKTLNEGPIKSNEINLKNKTDFRKKLFILLVLGFMVFASSYYFFFSFTSSPSLSINMTKRVLTYVGDKLNASIYLKNPTDKNIKILEVKVTIRSEENKNFVINIIRSSAIDYLKTRGVNITFPEEVLPHREEKIFWFAWEHTQEEPTGKYNIFVEAEVEKLGKLKTYSGFEVKVD